MNYLEVTENTVRTSTNSITRRSDISSINWNFLSKNIDKIIEFEVNYDKDMKPLGILYGEEEKAKVHHTDICVFEVDEDNNEFIWRNVNGESVYVPENINNSNNFSFHYALSKFVEDKNYTLRAYVSAEIFIKTSLNKENSYSVRITQVKEGITSENDARAFIELVEKNIIEDINEVFTPSKSKPKYKTIVK